MVSLADYSYLRRERTRVTLHSRSKYDLINSPDSLNSCFDGYKIFLPILAFLFECNGVYVEYVKPNEIFNVNVKHTQPKVCKSWPTSF